MSPHGSGTVKWPDTTEHINPPALIEVNDAWEQDLKAALWGSSNDPGGSRLIG